MADRKVFTNESLETFVGEIKSYADTAAKTVKDDLLNGAGAAYDTLKELGDLINTNVGAIEALELVASGKADKDHDHLISDITGLETALEGKAAASHGTHVAYSTTAPVMDGTASVGTATTVARSDHKHPTDTSRASKSEFDTHVATHAPSNAEKNQNAFSNIAVSGQTTVAADTATDTVTFAGSNVTITTDATNDKVTFTVADGSTSAKGVVQLTDSTSSTSTTTAATPKSVKSAYDLASTAKTSADAAQEKADSAYDLASSVVYVGPDMPTDPNVKVWINTAEEGTGVVPVMPRVATITLKANAWTGSAAPYSQVVQIATVTSATKVELNATVSQIVSLQNDDIALMAENSSGTVTVYSFGGKPSSDMTMQVTLTEVSYV